jgi:hypothetical protein
MTIEETIEIIFILFEGLPNIRRALRIDDRLANQKGWERADLPGASAPWGRPSGRPQVRALLLGHQFQLLHPLDHLDKTGPITVDVFSQGPQGQAGNIRERPISTMF